jgi:hypothetical protein
VISARCDNGHGERCTTAKRLWRFYPLGPLDNGLFGLLEFDPNVVIVVEGRMVQRLHLGTAERTVYIAESILKMRSFLCHSPGAALFD